MPENIRPRIGQPYPGQGGIFLGLIAGEAGQPDYELVAATADAEGVDLAWGRYGTEVDGAKSNLDGVANTKALLTSGNHPAAEFAAKYSADGHTDFYLPSRHELRLAYLNAPESFDKDSAYWTSTQYGPRSAFAQLFDYGGQSWLSKDGKFRVRPVRRIQAQ